ncbi:MAG: hypothetical protein MRZ79_10175 [Bacteroidia bacterium]|nr:hypothetical protein [Bacteroidia bacterium]
MKKTIDVIWYKGFYRKNYLLFFILIFIFGFFARPPHLFFSHYFIHPMLENLQFLGGTLAIFGIYWFKGILDSVKIISKPENRLIYQLNILPSHRLIWAITRQLLFVLAPVVGYMLLIVAYAIGKTPFLAVALSLGLLILLGASVCLMLYFFRHPREKVWKKGWQSFLGDRFKRSMTYISLLSLSHHNPRLLISLKAVSMLLLFSLGFAQSWPIKATYLCIWSILCLQAVVFFKLRQNEDGEIFLMRNLPISRFKRWLAYVGLCALLVLPEVLLWLIQGSQRVFIFDLFFTYLGIGMLSISILHHKALELATFVSHLLGLFLLGFIAILFGLPLILLAMGCLAFSWWIFWEEYYQWNGWLKE